MVSMHIFQKIRVHLQNGKTYSQIAREEGLSRATVRKYAQSNSPPKYKDRTRPSREDPLGEYYERIEQLMASAPNLTASEVFEWLAERGYQGSERTVQRRFKFKKDERPKERDFEQEYEPGEQSQFDFKESVDLPFVWGVQNVNLHVSTLPYSDLTVAKAYPNKNYECFMDGVQSFFEVIGGMTRNIRFDNLAPVVSKILDNGGRIYTRKFREATEHYGFGLLPCSPGRGNEKGDVERDIQTLSRRFLNHVAVEKLVFRDFCHLNEVLKSFIEKRQSLETQTKLAIEMTQLRPLPERNEDIICRSEEARATDLGTVMIMKSTYSVPDEVIGLKCWVVPGPYDVKIYRMANRRLVATHPRKNEGEHNILLEHCLRGLLRKPRAMIRWAHREILFPSEHLKTLYQHLKKQDDFSAEREFLRIINLVQQTALSEIITAVQLVLETDQITFESIKELLFVERRPANVLDVTERLNQQPISPDLQVYNQLIPKVGGGVQ